MSYLQLFWLDLLKLTSKISKELDLTFTCMTNKSDYNFFAINEDDNTVIGVLRGSMVRFLNGSVEDKKFVLSRVDGIDSVKGWSFEIKAGLMLDVMEKLKKLGIYTFEYQFKHDNLARLDLPAMGVKHFFWRFNRDFEMKPLWAGRSGDMYVCYTHWAYDLNKHGMHPSSRECNSIE